MAELEFLTVAELAIALKLHRASVYNMLSQSHDVHGVRPVRVGRRVLFAVDEIRDMLSKSRHGEVKL